MRKRESESESSELDRATAAPPPPSPRGVRSRGRNAAVKAQRFDQTSEQSPTINPLLRAEGRASPPGLALDLSITARLITCPTKTNERRSLDRNRKEIRINFRARDNRPRRLAAADHRSTVEDNPDRPSAPLLSAAHYPFPPSPRSRQREENSARRVAGRKSSSTDEGGGSRRRKANCGAVGALR